MAHLIYRLFLQVIPIVAMIGLILFVGNDYLLVGLYSIIILVSFVISFDKRDLVFLLFGCVALFFSEYFFISTGVEVFLRNSLFGIMPLWLPILWGYAFVTIRRSIMLLDQYLQ